ncbi:MAG: PVC-type heme-binding CxxCH protein [Verrucomicrobiota bacterium]|nr:PVC-type heme-binding CxxCH protein [Verrucomicrobiota bacterium]
MSGVIGFAAGSPLKLTKDDVVVFLGGTDMVRAQRSGHLETLLTSEFRNDLPRFRDLSWEADTVYALGTEIDRWRSGGFRGIKGLGSLETQLSNLNATVVIVQLGKNEAFAGVEGVDKFIEASDRLFGRLCGEGRQLIVLSPTAFENADNPLYPDLRERNADLQRYVNALRVAANDHEALFVDLFTNAEETFTSNGLHVTPDNQVRFALHIAAALGIERKDGFDGLRDLLTSVREKHRLWFDYWRPANWKCLFGDDNRRVFSIGNQKNVPSIRDERNQIPELIDAAELNVAAVAKGLAKPRIAKQIPLPSPTPAVLPEEELKEFRPAAGFEVNLFVSEKLGVENPLTMRWDAEGRMYVACTWTYPHLKPGEIPNDKIILLTDTDGDGQADFSTIFADGLNIPTGLETGNGGVYVGQSTDLLFLRDKDGDGVADERKLVLSGFGTGDTHQAMNSFTWSPDGELFFCQGDGIESRVETPWGVSSLYQAGVYRLRPGRLELHGLLDDFMGPGNPWGVVFDDWGQSLVVDGAGGVSYLTPASIPAKHRLRLGRIGNPGGYCGVEMLNGRNMPESMRGQFVINDFKSNTVKRFELQPIGSGFKLGWREPVLKSSHRKFRPVDIRMGPDGAIYVADFYNNVICHQDDYFRDPSRDLHHGRIWRVTYKKNPLTPKPAFAKATTGQLLDMLKAPERWTRQQAKFELSKRHGSLVSDIADRWIRRMKTNEPNYSRNLLEALALCATAEATSPQLLERALSSGDHRVRAFAARIAGRWHDRLANTHELLELAANDSHPQVRLEAILSCGQIPQASLIHLAAQAVTRHSRDTWIDYAFTQSVRHQEPFWMDGLTEGTLDFEDDTDSMLAVFEKGGSGKMLSRLMALAKSEDIKPDGLPGIYKGIASVGGPRELRQIFEPVFHLSAASQEAAWGALAASRRDEKPEGDLQVILRPALEGTNDQLRIQALGLIARWKVSELHEASAALAFDDAYSQATRLAAVRTLGELGANETKRLAKLVSSDVPIGLRIAGLESLARLDLPEAAKLGADMVAGSQSIDEVLQTFLNRAAGGQALTQALDKIRIGKAAAATALARMQSIGSSETTLMDYLGKVAGVKINVPTYSASYVSSLAKVAAKADAANGKQIFTTAGCIACHKVGAVNNNGIPFIGPELETIGNTLSTERIIEETIWPGRHVKEGYSLLQVTTKNGDIHQGYEQRSRAKDVILRPLTQEARIIIRHGEIREQTELGSAMPAGLTANLSKQQLADLIRYLAELGRN